MPAIAVALVDLHQQFGDHVGYGAPDGVDTLEHGAHRVRPMRATYDLLAAGFLDQQG